MTEASGRACRTSLAMWPASCVASVHGPVTGHQHVDGDELAGAGLAGLEFVELHPAFLVGLEDPLHCGLVLGGEGGVHQAGGGAAHDADARPDDVRGDASATMGSRRCQPVRATAPTPSDDADGGPDIGEQVLGIGFKRNGVALAPHPQQQQGHDEVHQRGQHRNRQAQADLFERFGSDAGGQPPRIRCSRRPAE